MHKANTFILFDLHFGDGTVILGVIDQLGLNHLLRSPKQQDTHANIKKGHNTHTHTHTHIHTTQRTQHNTTQHNTKGQIWIEKCCCTSSRHHAPTQTYRGRLQFGLGQTHTGKLSRNTIKARIDVVASFGRHKVRTHGIGIGKLIVLIQLDCTHVCQIICSPHHFEMNKYVNSET